MSAVAVAPERPPTARVHHSSRAADRSAWLEGKVSRILSRHPAVGLAVGLVERERVTFCQRGFADISSALPITEDTVFRIGSITKTLTAIAVLQLWERGLVDLDAPASAYLRGYELVSDGFSVPTLRQLLTHTSGIPDLLRATDLLHAGLTPDDGRPPVLSAPAGEPLPSLAEYYAGGLRVVAEPGHAFAYSNHGFATLGQIIEDVAGVPLERYFREQIFEPLGMLDSDLVRSGQVAARLATGFVIGRGGARPVPDRDWITVAATNVYATPRDLARYAAALLNGGSNDHGSILPPATLALMFEPHFQPDPRLPGMGLGFFRSDVGGRRLVGHDGILPGFNSTLLVAPDDDVAVIGLTNGSPGAFGWLGMELQDLLAELLEVGPDHPRGAFPQHPEIWGRLCGRYRFQPPADLRQELMLGLGAEVVVRGGHLLVRVLTPIPVLYRGLPLEPDDPADPFVFRLDFSQFGIPPVRVAFADVVDGQARTAHTDFGGQPWTLVRAPDRSSRQALVRGLAGGAVLAAVAVTTRRRRASR